MPSSKFVCRSVDVRAECQHKAEYYSAGQIKLEEDEFLFGSGFTHSRRRDESYYFLA